VKAIMYFVLACLGLIACAVAGSILVDLSFDPGWRLDP